MLSREDEESNERLLTALMGGAEGESEEYAALSTELGRVVERSKDVPSHRQLDLDENGEPTLLPRPARRDCL